MQSSARNCLPARLKTASHSPAGNRSGPEGGRPSVAVDNGEPAEASLRPALAATPGEQAHRGADTSRNDEARSQRAGCEDRQLRAQVRPHRADGIGELLALRLDLAANLFEVAAVTGHCA